MLLLKILLTYSLHFVCKMALTCVFSLVRQESLVAMLWGALNLRQQPGSSHVPHHGAWLEIFWCNITIKYYDDEHGDGEP